MKKEILEMCRKLTPEGRENVRQDILKMQDELIKFLSELNSPAKAGAVRLNREKLSFGYVRVALIGVTSCGKSTTNNATSKSIVVPENPMTSTPVPTYIVYGAQREMPVKIYREVEGVPEEKYLTTKEFLIQYCYNEKDQGCKNREKFQYDKYALVQTPSDFLKKGVILVDTLGIGAVDVDTMKTAEIIKEGIDFVIFVTSNANLNQREVDFLQNDLLGFGKKELERPLDYHSLLILVNEKDYIPRSGFRESLRLIFQQENCTLSKEEIEDFIKNQVLFVNARDARMQAVGPYPYVEYAPTGSSEEYLRDAKVLEKKEKRLALELKEDEDEDGNWKEVMKRLDEEMDVLFSGERSVIANICQDAFRDAEGTKGALKTAIQFYKDRNADFSQMIKDLRLIQADLSGEGKKTRDDLIRYGTKMVDCVGNCLKKIELSELFGPFLMKAIKEDCASIPKDLPEYTEFKKMTDTKKMDTLTKILSPILENLLAKAAPEASNYLLSLNKDGPKQELEKLEEYLNSQVSTLNGHVNRMDDAKIQRVGILLPSEKDIQNICNSMRGKISNAILDCFKFFGKHDQWQKQLKVLLPQIKLSFFQGLFARFDSGSRKKFWEKLKESIIILTCDLLGKAMQGDNNQFFTSPILECFSNAGDSFRDTYRDLEKSCEMAIESANADPSPEENERTIKRYTQYIEVCDSCIKKIEEDIQQAS